jgi:chromosome partitioning protein
LTWINLQGNLSAALGADLNDLSLTGHRLLINEEAEIEKFLSEVHPHLKLPNTIDVDADDLLEARKVNRELILRRKLGPVLREFDVVVIDTPPAMRAAMLTGLAVADVVIIPIDSSYFPLLGLSPLLHVVAAVREAHKPDMVIRALATGFVSFQGRHRPLFGLCCSLFADTAPRWLESAGLEVDQKETI